MNLYFSLLKLKARLFEGRKLSRADIHRQLALKRRAELSSVRMIGVTGSGAKSTTSALVYHMLSACRPSALSILENTEPMIAPRLARFPREASYGVFELSGHAPGVLDSVCELVQPDVAIVTVIASDHRTSFRGQGGAAREKINLPLNTARRGGLVLLNADDPEVIAMREQLFGAQVLTYGEAEVADYQAIDVQHSAAGCLQFLCRVGLEEVRFEFALLGRHLLVPALASIACAHQAGISLAQLAERGRRFVQLPGRCSLHVNPQGPTFICDTVKAPYSTLGLSFAQMDLFQDVPRKTIVIGQISDYAGAQGDRYRQVYRLARQHAERVIFLGRSGLTIKPLEGDEPGRNLVLVDDIKALRQLIAETALSGEVILLKGSYKVDHMERIALDYESQVKCWISGCMRACTCFDCDRLAGDRQGRRASALGSAYMIDEPDYFCDAIVRDVQR